MNIGNSLLPSTPQLRLLGDFEIKILSDLDTHGLFHKDRLIAIHPNGYSLKKLADRMNNRSRYLEQAQYILDCGGMTRSLTHLRSMVGE